MNKIVIIVRGGVVQAIHSDEDIKIYIVDHDDIDGMASRKIEEYAMAIHDYPRSPDSLGEASAILKQEITEMIDNGKKYETE